MSECCSPEVGLYLYLSPQLVLHRRLLELRLEEDLECHHKLALLLPGQIHTAKLACTTTEKKQKNTMSIMKHATTEKREETHHLIFKLVGKVEDDVYMQAL